MNKKLDEEISKLADLFEYGNLLASTDPAEFVKLVREEIIKLRKDTAPARL